MATFTISSNSIIATINSAGAELISVRNKQNEKQYIWCGDSKFWKRHSPVLFPLVGKYKNNSISFKGETYSLQQHGFARDKEFTLTSQKQDELWFRLQWDEDTLQSFPFQFELYCGYKIIDNCLKVMWKVFNKDNHKMYFSIGAHPAFAPPEGEVDMTNCCFEFITKNDKLQYALLNKDGLYQNEKFSMQLDKLKRLLITNDMFDDDALVVENHQSQEVHILDANRDPYVTVQFDAPLFGLWSPVHSNVPFVCIEPWYGRCDSVEFQGDLTNREWQNELDRDKEFYAEYNIIFY